MEKPQGEQKISSLRGSGSEIEEQYRRYGPMVLRRCRQLLKDEEKAKEAMQEVFVKFLHNKDKLKSLYLSSLLFRSSTNTCLNMIRDQRPGLSLDTENVPRPVTACTEIEDRMMFKDMLERIFKREKPSTREIAVMRFVDGMTLKEVAKEIGLSVSGVRKRILELRTRVKNSEEIYEEK